MFYQKTCDFMLRLHPAANKFPKRQRSVPGQRIGTKTLEPLHSMIVANAEHEKAPTLERKHGTG